MGKTEPDLGLGFLSLSSQLFSSVFSPLFFLLLAAKFTPPPVLPVLKFNSISQSSGPRQLSQVPAIWGLRLSAFAILLGECVREVTQVNLSAG